MTGLRYALTALVAVEIGGAAYLVVNRLQDPLPPQVAGEHLDSLSRAELAQILAGMDPRDANGWRDLGVFYLAFGYYPESAACHRRAAELLPQDPDVLYDLGFSQERLGQVDDAIESLQRAVGAGSERHRECQFLIGRCLLRQEKLDEADEAFRTAGDHPPSVYERARLALRRGKPDQASIRLSRLPGQSEHAKAERLRGTIQQALGQSALADQHFDLSDRLKDQWDSPIDREVRRIKQVQEGFGMPNWLRQQEASVQQRPAEVVENVRTMLAQNWSDNLADFLADLEIAAGRPQAAVKLLEEVVAREGASPFHLWRLGGMLDFAGQRPTALETCERALRMSPELRDALPLYQMLAVAYLDLGDEANALRCRAGAERAAGIAAFYERQFSIAQQALMSAVEHAPGDASAWFYLAEARRIGGDLPAATKAYEQCLKINPQHGRAVQGAARAAAAKR